MKKQSLIVLAATVLGLCGAHAQNLVQNPGFENGNLTDWTVSTSGVGTLTVGVNNSTAFASAHGGSYFEDSTAVVNANGNYDMILSQTVAVTPGQTYDLSFWLRDLSPSSAAYTYTVNFGGAQVLSHTGELSHGGYTEYSYTGIAGGTGVLTFEMSGNPGANSASSAGLDDVSVTATPEPSSIVLSGAGVISLLAFARRRNV